MSTNALTPQEKKLKDLRKILTVCFIGITLSIILLASLPAFLIDSPVVSTNESMRFEGLMAVFLAGMLIMICVTGMVCVTVYYVFKHRLEKEDELFL